MIRACSIFRLSGLNLLSGELLKTLASQKIYSVWFENNEIQTTDGKFSVTAVK